MHMQFVSKHIIILTFLISLIMVGCSAPDKDSASDPSKPGQDKMLIEICVDGKVAMYGDAGQLIPVSNILVTIVDAEGKVVASTRTKGLGRYLIEAKNVNVGYDWNKYIFIEITDDPDRTGYKDDNELKSVYFRKNFKTVLDGKVVITMEDIIMQKLNNR